MADSRDTSKSKRGLKFRDESVTSISRGRPQTKATQSDSPARSPSPASRPGNSLTPSTETTTPNLLPRFYTADRRPTIEPTVASEGTFPPPVTMDKLNTEYFYYTVALREMLPLMTLEKEKRKILAWVEKLTSPPYQTFALREKRNKYLVKLCLSVIIDEAYGVFSHPPPGGTLPPVESLVKDPVPARWEMDGFWRELLQDLPADWDHMDCSVHEECSENRDESGRHPLAGELLDQEFRFFLYLARPFTLLLENASAQAKLCLWLQTLARIRPTSCLAMKGIRNDYMQALLGYVQDFRMTGPFHDFPPLSQPLPPLVEFIKRQIEQGSLVSEDQCGAPLTDPTNPFTETFIESQPKPENGAFCYVAITGEVKDLAVSPHQSVSNVKPH